MTILRESYFDDIFCNDRRGPESSTFPSYVELVLKDLNNTASQLTPSRIARSQSLPTIKSIAAKEDAPKNLRWAAILVSTVSNRLLIKTIYGMVDYSS